MKLTFPKWKVNGNEELLKRCPGLHSHPEAIDLLTQMLQLEPSKRITIKAALNHPFFTKPRSPVKHLTFLSPVKSIAAHSHAQNQPNKENLFTPSLSQKNNVALYEDAFNVIPPHLL